MTPKERAKDIFEKHKCYLLRDEREKFGSIPQRLEDYNAMKKHALITVNEILAVNVPRTVNSFQMYWEEVKEEIEKIKRS